MDLKDLGDKTDQSFEGLPLTQLSAKMLTASPGRRVCAEITWGTTDKHESILPLAAFGLPAAKGSARHILIRCFPIA